MLQISTKAMHNLLDVNKAISYTDFIRLPFEGHLGKHDQQCGQASQGHDEITWTSEFRGTGTEGVAQGSSAIRHVITNPIGHRVRRRRRSYT